MKKSGKKLTVKKFSVVRELTTLFLATILLATFLLTTVSTAAHAQTLTRVDNQFLLEGQPLTPFGLRAANALENDEIAARFMAALPAIKASGMQQVNISLQGAHTGSVNAFTPQGELRPEVMARANRVLDAVRAEQIVAVVTMFYVERDQLLGSPDAVRAAVTNATNWLKPRRDLWFYVSNEPTHGGHDDAHLLSTAEGRQELYALIKSLDPARLTYMDTMANDGFLLLSSTHEIPCAGDITIELDRFDRYAYEQASPPGVFASGDRSSILQYIRDAHACGGTVFLHAAWHQQVAACEAKGCGEVARGTVGSSQPTTENLLADNRSQPSNPPFPRFDAGGSGTSTSPGMAFAWDLVAQLAPTLPRSVPQNVLSVAAVQASQSQAGNLPQHTLDGSLNTRWAAEGIGQWIRYDLGQPALVEGVGIAWYLGNTRQNSFAVAVSVDGGAWVDVWMGKSSGQTLDIEPVTFPPRQARYIRITGQGNTLNRWVSMTEAVVYGTRNTAPPGPPTALYYEQMTLAWDWAEGPGGPGMGFRIQYGTQAGGPYTEQVEIADITARQATIPLPVGTWYITAVTYAADGRISERSNEVVATVTAPEPPPECPEPEPCPACPECPEPEPATALICPGGIAIHPVPSGMQAVCVE